MYLKDFVRANGGLFLHPKGVTGEDTILHLDDQGFFVETAVETLQGAKTKRQNHRGWIGGVRHPIEQVNTAQKQNKIFKNQCAWQLTEPFSEQMIKQFKYVVYFI